MGDGDQRVQDQPGQAADVVESVCILDLDPYIRITQGPYIHYHIHDTGGTVLLAW